MPDRADIEIVNDIKKGSVAAFHELYSRYSDMVYRNSLARVNNSVDADDIFQEFFIRLRNHILNSIKQEQVRDKYQGKCAPEETDDYTWVKIVSEDLNENIRRIVSGFPSRLQCVYMLRHEQNLSIKEIAEKLSVSEQTIKNQLGDILHRLQHEVRQKNFLFSF